MRIKVRCLSHADCEEGACQYVRTCKKPHLVGELCVEGEDSCGKERQTSLRCIQGKCHKRLEEKPTNEGEVYEHEGFYYTQESYRGLDGKECTKQEHCFAATDYCDRETNQCLPRLYAGDKCKFHYDCEDGLICLKEKCTIACVKTSDCGFAQTCSSTNICVISGFVYVSIAGLAIFCGILGVSVWLYFRTRTRRERKRAKANNELPEYGTDEDLAYARQLSLMNTQPPEYTQ